MSGRLFNASFFKNDDLHIYANIYICMCIVKRFIYERFHDFSENLQVTRKKVQSAVVFVPNGFLIKSGQSTLELRRQQKSITHLPHLSPKNLTWVSVIVCLRGSRPCFW